MTGLFHRIVAAAAVSVFALSSVSGAYLDSDYRDSDTGSSVRPSEIIRPIPPPHRESNPVIDLISKIAVGAPYRYAGLTIFPLVVNRAGSRGDIRTLDEALRNDWIVVREKDTAEVNEVHVRNDSRHMVFLMAGEIVAGGRQNRVIREDVLLPPGSGFIEIPVYCVEQERWAGKTDRFFSPASMAHQGLRKSAVAGESQDSIWREAAAKSESVGVRSKTRNYQEIYEDRDVKRRIDGVVSHLDCVARRNTVGAVAVAGDRIISCDVFTDPDLFSRLWSKLCRSYALEDVSILEKNSSRWHDYSTSVTVRDVERFLSDARHAGYDHRSTPGAGRALQISGPVSGAAIIWDDMAVHAALFPGYTAVPMPLRGGIRVE